jgi:DNA invertase Pin-like site-specific DNA recombinase
MKIMLVETKIGVGYVRTSSNSNPKSSIPNQINAVKNFAKKNNIILRDILKDECISGTSTVGREGYQLLKIMIEKEQIDTVIVSFFDRLGRDSFEFASTLSSLSKKGVNVVSASENLSSNNMTPLQQAIAGVQVELDNKQRTLRSMDGKIQSIARGNYIWKEPFGYKREKNKLIIVPEEAKAVKEIYLDYLRGRSIAEIVRYQTENNPLCKGKWNFAKITAILRNKNYIGQAFKQQKSIVNGNLVLNYTPYNVFYEGIISEKTFDRAIRRRTDNFKNNDAPRFFVSGGLLLCPACLKPMKYKEEKFRCIKDRVYFYANLVEELLRDKLVELDQEKKVNNSIVECKQQIDDILERKIQNEIRFAKAKVSYEKYTENVFLYNQELKKIKLDLYDDSKVRKLNSDFIMQDDFRGLKKQLITDHFKFTINEFNIIKVIPFSIQTET